MVLDGYVRVSQLRGRGGEGFISPALQREQIEGWVRLRGARLGEVFEELDVPGAARERPLLERALARIEAGASDGLSSAGLPREELRGVRWLADMMLHCGPLPAAELRQWRAGECPGGSGARRPTSSLRPEGAQVRRPARRQPLPRGPIGTFTSSTLCMQPISSPTT